MQPEALAAFQHPAGQAECAGLRAAQAERIDAEIHQQAGDAVHAGGEGGRAVHLALDADLRRQELVHERQVEAVHLQGEGIAVFGRDAAVHEQALRSVVQHQAVQVQLLAVQDDAGFAEMPGVLAGGQVGIGGMRPELQDAFFVAADRAREVDGGFAGGAGETVVADAQRELVVVRGRVDGRVQHRQRAGAQLGADDVGAERLREIVQEDLDVAQVVGAEGEAVGFDPAVEEVVVDGELDARAVGHVEAGQDQRQQLAGVVELQLHVVVAGIAGFHAFRVQGGEVALQRDVLDVPDEIADGGVAADAAVEERGVQADPLLRPFGLGVQADVADGVRALAVGQDEVLQRRLAVEAAVLLHQVGADAGGDVRHEAAFDAHRGQVRVVDGADQAVAAAVGVRLQVDQAGQFEPERGIVALDAAAGRAVQQGAGHADVMEVAPEGVDFLDAEGIDPGGRESGGRQRGVGAGVHRDRAEGLDAEDVAEVQLARADVQRGLERPAGLGEVIDDSVDVEIAGGALQAAVHVQLRDRAARLQLQGEGNAVGELAEVRRALAGDAGQELGEGGGRAREVLDLHVERQAGDVGQPGDAAGEHRGDAGGKLVERETVHAEVADRTVDAAAADVQRDRAAVEAAGEVGERLQGEARTEEFAFEADLVEEIGQGVRGGEVQREQAHAQVRPGIAEPEVLDERPAVADLDAGAELLDAVAGLLPGRQAVQGPRHLRVRHLEVVAGDVGRDVQVLEVDAETLVGPLVGEEARHPETEVLDAELLDVKDVVR